MEKGAHNKGIEGRQVSQAIFPEIHSLRERCSQGPNPPALPVSCADRGVGCELAQLPWWTCLLECAEHYWSAMTLQQRSTAMTLQQHFKSVPRSLIEMSAMVINWDCSQDPCLSGIKESRWIRTLGISFPLGMNLRGASLWKLPPFNTSGTSCASFPIMVGT